MLSSSVAGSAAMSTGYPWYKSIAASREIYQGDLIEACPVVEIPSDYDTDLAEKPFESREVVVDADVRRYNVVVLTQTCDIANHKSDIILVCPVFPAKVLFEDPKRGSYYRSEAGRESLRRGNEPPFHPIRSSDLPELPKPAQIADFRSVYGVPRKLLEDIAERTSLRLRMLPPYREHLAQAFARYFMRVALPVGVDLPEASTGKTPSQH